MNKELERKWNGGYNIILGTTLLSIWRNCSKPQKKKVDQDDAKSRYEWKKDLTNMKHESCSYAVPVCTKTQQCYAPAIYHNDI